MRKSAPTACGSMRSRRPTAAAMARAGSTLSASWKRGTIPAEKLNKKVAEINAIIAKLDDGKAVFFKDIGKEFLDQSGGLSGEIMPDYLHLSAKGYDIWGKAIKADIEKLIK